MLFLSFLILVRKVSYHRFSSTQTQKSLSNPKITYIFLKTDIAITSFLTASVCSRIWSHFWEYALLWLVRWLLQLVHDWNQMPNTIYEFLSDMNSNKYLRLCIKGTTWLTTIPRITFLSGQKPPCHLEKYASRFAS